MKTLRPFLSLFLLLKAVPFFSQTTFFDCGKAVATCFPGYVNNDPNQGVANSFVVAMFDVRDRSAASPATPWNPPVFHDNSWKTANLGTVFGAAIDKLQNVYLSASSVYSATVFGPAGAGGIYRISPFLFTPVPIVTTNSNPASNTVGTFTLPNTGPALGDLAYDLANHQLFVTNFEDGRIYRIAADGHPMGVGKVLSAYDPFAADNGAAGWSPKGERIWGVGVFGNKVFFSRWKEDYNAGTSSDFNEIWSVALLSNGEFSGTLSGGYFTGNEQFEFNLPDLTGNNFSCPISDIAFAQNGDMLLAERTMIYDPPIPYAHASRLLRYPFPYASSAVVPTGFGFFQNNSAGGTDWGYGGFDNLLNQPIECDSFIWASGDALLTGLYGLEGVSVSNTSPSNGYYVDLNANLLDTSKTGVGDVEVFCNTCATSSISGVKYLDIHCFNQSYSNQPTLPGWTITLCDANNNFLQNTVTNANGAYAFTNLTPGTYIVKETQQPLWYPTQPQTGMATVTLGLFDTVTVNFGNCPACSCDSIQFAVQPLSPCCYELSVQNTSPYCFSEINMVLSSGQFTNVVAANGWTATASGQTMQLLPASPLIPTGTSQPVQFCVSGVTNPFNLTVSTFYGIGGELYLCDKSFSFECPAPQPCVSECPGQNWMLVAQASNVFALEVFQGKLIVGGQFNQVGTTSANNIAAWDGTTWTPLGTGTNNIVLSLAAHGGKLYAGGAFTLAGGVPVSNIAVWDGTTWADVGGGVTNNSGPSNVRALLSMPNALAVGGEFSNVGFASLPATNVATWDAVNNLWSSLGSGLPGGFVSGLGSFNGNIVAGGIFNNPPNNIAWWNGSSWQPFPNGINLISNNMGQGVADVQQLGPDLVVGGRFMDASLVPNTRHVALWNGAWQAMDDGVQSSFEGIYDLHIFNGELYAGGFFSQIGNSPINSVARWDAGTAQWQTTNFPGIIVRALETWSPANQKDACELYAAGEGSIMKWKCPTIGVQNPEVASVVFSPNPVADNLNIRLSDHNSTEPWRVQIVASDGRLLVEQFASGSEIESNLSKLPRGMYYVFVFQGNTVWRGKVVKQ
jgi:hypothetical protein